ncbi:MAG: site-2 protease family protein [Alphaproteobacteria bacterium]
MGDLSSILFQATTWVLPALFAITFHEAAHGWVASKLGDDTALKQGRVTFNPLSHIDPLGTVLLPALLLVAGSPFLFGYAKPVPVNFRKLGRLKRDMVLVAAAGPGMNVLIALGCAFALHVAAVLPSWLGPWVGANLLHAIVLNIVLAVFNMLPVPPLDGGRVLVGLLPPPLDRRVARLERYGMFIVIGFLMLPPLIGYQLGIDLNVAAWVLGPPVDLVAGVIIWIAGSPL